MTKKQTNNKKAGFADKFALIIAALLLSAMPVSLLFRASASDDVPVLTRTAILRSPNGGANPHGAATFEVYQNNNRELEVEVEDLSLPDNTVLSVFIDGNGVGQANVVSRRAKLKLRSESGQTVPNVNNGSIVQVKNVTTVIVAGTFGASNSTPTPTVTPSITPTITPTVTPTITPSVSPTPNNASELFAALSGATINGVLPRGLAEYEVKFNGRRELSIYVNQINLPANTALTVSVNNLALGQITLDASGRGKLELETEHGQTVPTIAAGSIVKVNNGATTILAGTFGAGESPTPSPSPQNAQGKSFEAHLNAANLTPAINSNARGEIKVVLNSPETQAQVSGEFERLSSAQNSARISVTIGGATNLIFDLGALNSTQGHFSAQTFNVTAQQVQQLRTGLWFVAIGTTANPNGEIGGFLKNHSNHNDFDGDGRDDFAVFRPATGTWFTQNTDGFAAQLVGNLDDKIVSADYDGDGKTDAAVFGKGIWTIVRSSDRGTSVQQFGLASDIPVRGDFDGDGRSDLAVFRAETGVWYIQKSSNSGFSAIRFGMNGDKPISADFDGDGSNDIAVFRPSEGNWYWLRSSDAQFQAAHFGANGDIPIAGDFDGDNKADLSVFRPSSGFWFVNRSSNNSFEARQFGLSEDIPVVGDFDGDGKTDIAVFRPSNGVWYVLRSVDGSFDARQFGQNGDVPANFR